MDGADAAAVMAAAASAQVPMRRTALPLTLMASVNAVAVAERDLSEAPTVVSAPAVAEVVVAVVPTPTDQDT